MMGSNVNHHYMMVHNNARDYFKEQANDEIYGRQHKDLSTNSSNSTFKGINSVSGFSSPLYTSDPKYRDEKEDSIVIMKHRFENPAIPFPKSLVYPPSSFPTSNRENKFSKANYSDVTSEKCKEDRKEEQAEKYRISCNEFKYVSYLDKF